MSILEIIEKKKQGKVLTNAEFDFVITNMLSGQISKEQISSLLMCFWFKGLNTAETVALTQAMVRTGRTLSFDHIHGPIIDKHSTGGIGDKVSIIIGPLLAALRVKVAKLSGGGLGFTGGTLDKLHSVGMNTDLSVKQATKQLADFGFFIAQQTDDMMPADKILYSLRNAIGAVDCSPLIASSVMSKKLILKSQYIFIDLKVGDGAFCKTLAEGKILAKLMVAIGKAFKRKIVVDLTDMNQPLGRGIGNLLEIREAYAFLMGQPTSPDLEKFIYRFAKDVLVTTKMAKNAVEAERKIKVIIASRHAKQKFEQWVRIQEGNLEEIEHNLVHKAKFIHPIKAHKNGYVVYKSCEELGWIANSLGVNKNSVDSRIDYFAGIYLNKKTGEKVENGQTVATLYSSSPIPNELLKRFERNFDIQNSYRSKECIFAKITD